ncbi:hypothetical protein HMPREF0724_11453 [Prescottella equi ATCC 33707]|uniref:Uncharacterized protein n=1 Tax=Prescottella equi ATCC 33707 TaxID=525370 RepID=E9SZG1_RHOHA|nr:hypothetical protein HMPREF0724_11453 [Prescottella equi ATCC 33707]
MILRIGGDTRRRSLVGSPHLRFRPGSVPATDDQGCLGTRSHRPDLALTCRECQVPF